MSTQLQPMFYLTTTNPDLVLSHIVKVPYILLCPNLSYALILCLSFMYTSHPLHLHYPHPWLCSLTSIEDICSCMYLFVILNINLRNHNLLDFYHGP